MPPHTITDPARAPDVDATASDTDPPKLRANLSPIDKNTSVFKGFWHHLSFWVFFRTPHVFYKFAKTLKQRCFFHRFSRPQTHSLSHLGSHPAWQAGHRDPTPLGRQDMRIPRRLAGRTSGASPEKGEVRYISTEVGGPPVWGGSRPARRATQGATRRDPRRTTQGETLPNGVLQGSRGAVPGAGLKYPPTRRGQHVQKSKGEV